MIGKPILIAVAPNGARKNKADHPRLPLTTAELIETAENCLEAGAAMMHFHVRDQGGRHTLDPVYYAPALRELEAAVGEKMLLQVTSEAAGRYTSKQQIDCMKRLAPHCLSCGLQEIFDDPQHYNAGHEFCTQLHQEGVLIQYILYSPEQVEWYEKLCDTGVIPGKNHLLLFVLGRYDDIVNEKQELEAYVAALKGNNPWMVCGFGRQEHGLMGQAADLGGHCRVGFENNQEAQDGSTLADNASLVKLTSELVVKKGRLPADKFFAESLYSTVTLR